jgi:peptide deformylase
MDTEWTGEGGEKKPGAMLNPEIVAREGELTWNEGCLSVPDFNADVVRSARVRVRYQDLDGGVHEEDASELRAVCFQHEIDHLDGTLFIDRISRLKRGMYVQKRKRALQRELEDAAATPKRLT